MRTTVLVNDRMQSGYRYCLVAPTGGGFDPGFTPDLTPREMLELGVFCGKYMTDCRAEFPASWFKRARLSPRGRDCSLNHFGAEAGQPLRNGGARAGSMPTIRAAGSSGIAATTWGGACPTRIGGRSGAGKPSAQIRANGEPGDPFCRPRQRQALLQWAYDSRAL